MLAGRNSPLFLVCCNIVILLFLCCNGTARAKETINISCANSICAVIDFESLEKKLDVDIKILPAGSLDAFKNLLNNKADIAFVTAQLSDFGGAQNIFDPSDFTQQIMGYIKFVFLVNSANKLQTATIEQLREIYNGKIVNWNQIGGIDMPIKIFSVGAGFNIYYRTLSLLGLDAYGKNVIIDDNSSAANIANDIARNPGGIGTVVYNKKNSYMINGDVKEISEPILIPATAIMRKDSSVIIEKLTKLIQQDTARVYYDTTLLRKV